MTRSPIPPLSRIRSFRLWATVSVLLLVSATVATAVIAKIERDAASTKQAYVRAMLRPARTAEADPATTYADQEDGQRGFLLTGDDRALHKYVSGRTHAAGLQTTLQTLTGDDPQAITLLRGVVTAGVMWHQQAAEPQIAVRGKDRCGTPCWLPSSPRASDCSTQFVLASTR